MNSDPDREYDWTALAVGAVVVFVAFLIISFILTVKLVG